MRPAALRGARDARILKLMPVVSRISPHFSDEKYKTGSLEDLIDVFEDRLKFWVLAPAKALLDVQFGEMAALVLLLGYFEPHAIYIKGQASRRQSKAFFRAGFIDVFLRRSALQESFLAGVADMLYENARCGLLHDAMIREGIYVGEGSGELTVTLPRVNGKVDENGRIESVLIDARKFYIVVERHVTEYVKSLRDVGNSELRENFRKAVDLGWRPDGTAGRVIGMSENDFLNRAI